jgi:glycine cleavage system H lipoate-binding protein
MVPILVLLTFIIVLTAARLLSHGSKAETEAVSLEGTLRAPPAADSLRLEPGPYLHPGHVWVRFQPDGFATVGASEFAANFVGSLAGVDTPAKGAYLRQGEAAWTLVSGKNRRLTQAMPLEGEVVDVNRNLGALVTNGGAPARNGNWILKVRPSRRLAQNVQNLFGGTLAQAWEEMAVSRFSAALAPALGRVANDGGVWLENFGDLLDDFEWRALRNDLFPPEPGTAIR